jgi:riboflavin kinase
MEKRPRIATSRGTDREQEALHLEGEVLAGSGQAQHFVSIPGYLKQFEEKLGYTPFPGTLNIHLTSASIKHREELDRRPAIVIHGFVQGERVFGSSRCYPAKISGISTAVVIPERTHYPSDLIEVLAPVKLREALDLKDGDLVSIEISCPSVAIRNHKTESP